MSKPTNRICFSYQDFDGSGQPLNILLTFERDPKLSKEKNFEHVIARVRESYFTPKPEHHRRD